MQVNWYDRTPWSPTGHDFHVELGDLIANRYKVIHKIGERYHGTVWLCRDIESDSITYHAAKVPKAEYSQNGTLEARLMNLFNATDGSTKKKGICLPTRHFQISDTRGDYQVYVYPFLGPSPIERSELRRSEDGNRKLRAMCLELTRALKFLHSHKIIHNDIHPSTVLSGVTGIDGMTEEKLISFLDEPVISTATIRPAHEATEETTRNFVETSLHWECDVVTRFAEFTDQVYLTDFSHSFIADETSSMAEALPYEQDWGVSPGFQLHQAEDGYAKDIWALGEMIYEIRIGCSIFSPIMDPDGHLASICHVLGKMPEPMWSTTWESRTAYFKDEVDADGRVVDIEADEPYYADLMKDGDIIPRSIRETLAHCYDGPGTCLGCKLEGREIDLFADLLGKIFTWKAEDRISIEDIEKHPWFRM